EGARSSGGLGGRLHATALRELCSTRVPVPHPTTGCDRRPPMPPAACPAPCLFHLRALAQHSRSTRACGPRRCRTTMDERRAVDADAAEPYHRVITQRTAHSMTA